MNRSNSSSSSSRHPLQALYPHLNFSRIPAPSQLLVPSFGKRISQPVPDVPVSELAESVPEPESVPESVLEPESVPEPVKKLVVARPTRQPPVVKPEPKRGSHLPVKGERGIQRKYTAEQKKEMYMNRLSRKSIANADKEVEAVNAVLDEIGHDPIKLAEKEKDIKRQLQLISYSKFFTGTNAIETVNNITDDTIEPNEQGPNETEP